MSRRTLVYIGIAVALLVGGRLFSSGGGAPSPESASPSSTVTAPVVPSATAPFHAPPFKRPPSSMAELGVLTDRSAKDVEARLDRGALATAIDPALCGDAEACDAVRATVRDEHATTLSVVDAGDWSLSRIDVDAVARNLTATERAHLRSFARIAVVHVNTATSSRQLAVRTAFAATSALATSLRSLVWDQLLGRVENAHDFAAHAVTTPLGQPVFRRDRIELLYSPKGEGTQRLLTAGLSRWGVADVDAEPVATAGSERLGELVLAVAESIANGAAESPVTVSLDDLARARGKPYPADAGLPAPAPIEVDVQSVHPEAGDPNDFIDRIQPSSGDGALGYVNLAERFFGPLLAAAPGDDVLSARQDRAQAQLASALSRWSAAKTAGARLLVQLAFPIPGGGGSESMWLDVTRFDATHVTGRVIDEPLAATDVHAGDEVTRSRADVQDLDLRMPKD